MSKVDKFTKEATLERNLGKQLSETSTPYDTMTDSVAPGSEAQPTNGVMPESEWEVNMLKARVEADIGDATKLGYEADSYYKLYKSLHELMFALTNAGVITGETDDTYKSIVSGMEIAMNRQAKVWWKGTDDNPDADFTGINLTSFPVTGGTAQVTGFDAV